MTFVNGIGQITTDKGNLIALVGTPANKDYRAISMLNPLNRQTNTVTITSGSDVGTYTIVAVNDDTAESFTLASFTSGGGDNATAIAAGLVASYDPADDTRSIVYSISNNADVVTVVFNPAGQSYTVTAPETSSGGSAAVATTVAPDGTSLGFGLAVVDVGTGADRVAGLPTGATALQLAGVTVRDSATLARDANSGIAPPAVMPVMTDGEIWVTNTVASAAKGGQVYVVLATGAIRASADGGNTVAPTGWVFTSTAAAGEKARIKINR